MWEMRLRAYAAVSLRRFSHRLTTKISASAVVLCASELTASSRGLTIISWHQSPGHSKRPTKLTSRTAKHPRCHTTITTMSPTVMSMASGRRPTAQCSVNIPIDPSTPVHRRPPTNADPRSRPSCTSSLPTMSRNVIAPSRGIHGRLSDTYFLTFDKHHAGVVLDKHAGVVKPGQPRRRNRLRPVALLAYDLPSTLPNWDNLRLLHHDVPGEHLPDRLPMRRRHYIVRRHRGSLTLKRSR